MKQTRQKALILSAVQNRMDHPTAEMIYQELLEQDPHISLATVYRNLNQFAESGKIRKVELPNRKDCFDYNVMTHHHAYCVKCGRLFDVPVKSIKKRYQHLDNGFKVQEEEVLLKGICLDCQNIKKS